MREHKRGCVWCGKLFTAEAPLLGEDTHNFCDEWCAAASHVARERGTWAKDQSAAFRRREEAAREQTAAARAARE